MEKKILDQFSEKMQQKIKSDAGFQDAVLREDWKAAKTRAETIGIPHIIEPKKARKARELQKLSRDIKKGMIELKAEESELKSPNTFASGSRSHS